MSSGLKTAKEPSESLLSRFIIWKLGKKKVFVRTRQEEFGVGETMERLAEQLPENFVRCHRSFVVNEEHITQIRLSESLLYLGKELFVPISRTYKERFKGHVNE